MPRSLSPLYIRNKSIMTRERYERIIIKKTIMIMIMTMMSMMMTIVCAG